MAGRVLFYLTEEALYVANTGRAITRQGVISISRQYLSAKGELPPDDTFDCTDTQLVDAIRAKRLEMYRMEPNDLKEHASQEIQTRRDYAGRALWELLQNADDAMAPSGSPSSELIGAKGLGFKSVLEITEYPEIHSGAFHFGFDPDRSESLLREVASQPSRLVFRLPHPVRPDEQVRKLRKSGFVTVVKLPFSTDQSRRITVDRLKSLPPQFIILCQHLRSFEARFADDQIRKIARHGGELNTDASRVLIEIAENGATKTEEWRLWSRVWDPPAGTQKRLSAAIAVQTEGKSGVLTAEAMPVHVFFPTQESIQTPFLVHASFELRSDRNHLLPGDHDAKLLETLGELASRVATFLTPKSVIKLFAEIAFASRGKAGRMDRKIQRALAQAVDQTAFVPLVGGGYARPNEARIWGHNLPEVLKTKSKAVKDFKLCSEALSDVFPLLRKFESDELDAIEYASILRHVNCHDLESCLRAANVTGKACLTGFFIPKAVIENLSAAPFWLISDKKIRSLKAGRPLLRTRPSLWPDWLDADILDSGFADKLLGKGAVVNKPWGTLVEGRVLQSTDDVIVHCLVPALESWPDKQWTRLGVEALKAILAWQPTLEWSQIKPFVPSDSADSDPVRTALASVVRVPRGHEWVLAREAYASADIKGDAALASYFRKNTQSPIVGMAPKKSEIGREKWRSLLRYVGVSWEPKIRPFRSPHAWIGNELPGFSRYWHSVTAAHSFNWRRQDWYLDQFPECIANSSPRAIAEMLSDIFPLTPHLNAAYKKRSDASLTHRPAPFASCVEYQLTQEAYLPCRPGLGRTKIREVPNELFWPAKGLPGITSTVELGTYPKSQRDRLRGQFVRYLGVKDELPTVWRPWLDWARDLAAAADDGASRSDERLIRDFYEAFLAVNFVHPKPAVPKRIVCLTIDGLKSTPASEAIWLDDSKFASPEIQAALINAGTAIFPPMLARGEGSPARFGVRRASDVITVAPHYSEEMPLQSLRLMRRLHARRRAFAAMCERKNDVWAEPKVITAVHGLRLTFKLGDVAVATRAVPSFHREIDWLVNLDSNPWDALAAACAASFKNGPDLRLWFGLLLKATSKAEMLEILSEAGIPPYRLKEISLPDDEPADELPAPALETVPPTHSVAIESNSSPPIESSQIDDEPPAKPILKKRPLYDPPPQVSQGRRSRGRSIAAESADRARSRGLIAEAWFAERLAETLPDNMYPTFNVRDDEARESDVVITGPKEEWHIEIKSLTTTRVYWSELEQQKAVALRERYFMCFLMPTQRGQFQVHWSWNPLADLRLCKRRAEWVWAGVEPGPPLPENSWDFIAGLKRPERPADRLNYVIELQQRSLAALPQDDRTLRLLWQRLSPG